MKQPLIILTGPTAVGKTALSIRLAKALDGEIVSADSMQVYRHMDIGSAKITAQEMEGVPHHLIDVLDPWEEFNVAAFQKMALQAMEGIYARGHLPIITGGTGFYIQALLYGVEFEEDPEDSPVRRELYDLARREGESAPQMLHAMLAQVDPESASAIHPNNVKRVIRAIEYFRLTGTPISRHNAAMRKKEADYHFLYYVLTMDRERLYGRIDKRVDQMLSQGLVEEPAKTIFFLISDLEEGGNRAGLLRRLEELKGSGVTVVVLLAIADSGKPYYDAQTAQRIAGMDIPCFACAPDRLPELLERVLKKQDLTVFTANDTGKVPAPAPDRK